MAAHSLVRASSTQWATPSEESSSCQGPLMGSATHSTPVPPWNSGRTPTTCGRGYGGNSRSAFRGIGHEVRWRCVRQHGRLHPDDQACVVLGPWTVRARGQLPGWRSSGGLLGRDPRSVRAVRSRIGRDAERCGVRVGGDAQQAGQDPDCSLGGVMQHMSGPLTRIERTASVRLPGKRSGDG